MKKLVSLLLVALICVSVFAVEVSVGAFSAGKTSEAQTPRGLFGKVAYFPYEKEEADFGFVAEFGRGKDSETLNYHDIFALRFAGEIDFENISVEAGFGVKFNGLVGDGNNNAALDVEVAAKYHINEKFSAGLALDLPFREHTSVDLLNSAEKLGTPAEDLFFAPVAKAFVTYNF